MSLELIDEYYWITHPELVEKVSDVWEMALTTIQLQTVDEFRKAAQAKMRMLLAVHDQTILDAAGLTIDDLIATQRTAIARQRGGSKLPQGRDRVAQRRKALLAIRKADIDGLTWAETIDAAQVASQEVNGRELDRKTLDAWLRTLHRCKLVSFDAPEPKGRGRPRKRNS
ncbi:MAG: hypothetical protein ACK4GO_17235 [Gemmobacter sp.]